MKRFILVLVVLTAYVVTLSGGHVYAKARVNSPWWNNPCMPNWCYGGNGGGEVGEDIWLPTGTPITALCAGNIVGAGFYPGGGVVSIRCPNVGDVYVQHLDSIANWISHCENGPCGQTVPYGTYLGDSGGECGWHFYGDPCASGFSYSSHVEVGINPPWYGIWGPAHPGGSYDPSGFVAGGGSQGSTQPASQNTNPPQVSGGSGVANDTTTTTTQHACPYVLGNYLPGSGIVACDGMFVIGPTGSCPCNSLTLIEGLTGKGDLYHFRGNEEIIYKAARSHGVKYGFDRYVYTGEKIYVPI